MALLIETFEDLVHIIETHPEWRRRLKRSLFDIDIEAALSRLEAAIEELVVIQRQQAGDIAVLKTDVGVLKTDVGVLKTDVGVLKTDVGVLKTDVGVLKTDVGVLKTDVGVLKTDVGVLKTDVGVLKTGMSQLDRRVANMATDVATVKGKSYEHDYRLKANAIFGRFIRRGRDRTDDVADRLHDAVAAGTIPVQELAQILSADLLWGGKARGNEREIIVVLEASWRAETADVERAWQRAAILRRIGMHAIPVVAGMAWDEQALTLADARAVAVAANGQIDADSWQKALLAALAPAN